MTVKRLIRKIVFFFIVLNWLVNFFLKALELIEKLFG